MEVIFGYNDNANIILQCKLIKVKACNLKIYIIYNLSDIMVQVFQEYRNVYHIISEDQFGSNSENAERPILRY